MKIKKKCSQVEYIGKRIFSNPQPESNPWPSWYRLDTLTTELCMGWFIAQKLSPNFDFCACLSKRVIKRDSSEMQERIQPFSADCKPQNVKNFLKMGFLGKTPGVNWVNYFLLIANNIFYFHFRAGGLWVIVRRAKQVGWFSCLNTSVLNKLHGHRATLGIEG